MDQVIRTGLNSWGVEVADEVDAVVIECPFLKNPIALASLSDHVREEFRCAIDALDGQNFLWVWHPGLKVWCKRGQPSLLQCGFAKLN
eukprot:gene8003-1678_t